VFRDTKWNVGTPFRGNAGQAHLIMHGARAVIFALMMRIVFLFCFVQ